MFIVRKPALPPRPTHGGRRKGAGRKSVTDTTRAKLLRVNLAPAELRALKEYAARHDSTVADLVRAALRPYTTPGG